MKRLKLLGLIPARAGSKGLPGKNIKPLAGLPLVGWTIRAAGESGVLDRILVSTDSADIAQIAKSLGASAPWLRPAELAADNSPSIDFALHALDRLKTDDDWEPDAVVLLQPTSPFRSAQTVRGAVELFKESAADSLASVSAAAVHPWSCYFLDGPHRRLRRAVSDAPEVLRRQDMPAAYAVDGLIYITTPSRLRKTRRFIHSDTIAFISPPDENLDIDTPEDWAAAENLAAGAKKQ